MSLLFWAPGDALATATRASTAKQFDSVTGVWVDAAIDTARDAHDVWDATAAAWVRTLLLEEERINLFPHGREVNSWTTATSAGVGVNTNAGPDGATHADRVDDASSGSQLTRAHNATGLTLTADDYTLSLYVLKDSVTTRFPEIVLRISTATTVQCGVRFATHDGSIAAAVAGTPDYFATIDERHAYWRVVMGMANPNASNTALRFEVFPARAATFGGANANSAQGSIVVDYAQIETGSFATSPIWTAGSSATRNADAVTLAGSWSNQEVTQYYRYFDLASLTWTDAIVVFTGTAPQAPPLNRAYGADASGYAIKVAPGNQTIEYMRALEPAGGETLVADPGAFVITGTDADLTYTPAGESLVADPGSFVITGPDATFRLTRHAASGHFQITGWPATLRTARRLDAESGAFAITGADAGLRAGRRLTAEPGSFTVTGTAATLTTTRVLSAEPGAFTITGTDADMVHSVDRILHASPGAFAITGTAATLAAHRRLSADAGALTITGTDAGLRVGRVLVADPGTFAIDGADATLVYTPVNAYALTADPGAFVINGTAATLTFTPLVATRDVYVTVTPYSHPAGVPGQRRWRLYQTGQITKDWGWATPTVTLRIRDVPVGEYEVTAQDRTAVADGQESAPFAFEVTP